MILIKNNLIIKAPITSDGLVSNFEIATHCLQSAECVNGNYLNHYDILIPNRNGEDLTAKIFTKILIKILVKNFKYYRCNDNNRNPRKKGYKIVEEKSQPKVLHIIKYDTDPVLFTKIIIKSLKRTLNLIGGQK